jgi:hypothetical protein
MNMIAFPQIGSGFEARPARTCKKNRCSAAEYDTSPALEFEAEYSGRAYQCNHFKARRAAAGDAMRDLVYTPAGRRVPAMID